MASNQILDVILTIWVIFWKGIGLWRAARDNQRNWFIALLIFDIYTIGILDIVYLFKFARKPLTITELRSWFFKEK